VGESRDCPNFWVSPIISGTGKATNFKFCTHIPSIVRDKSPLQISGKVAGCVVRTLNTFQCTHILGASRGLLCDSSAVLLLITIGCGEFQLVDSMLGYLVRLDEQFFRALSKYLSGKGGPLRKIGPYAWPCMLSIFFTARCMSSIRPSVCPSDCDVGGSAPRSLEILETNCTRN